MSAHMMSSYRAPWALLLLLLALGSKVAMAKPNNGEPGLQDLPRKGQLQFKAGGSSHTLVMDLTGAVAKMRQLVDPAEASDDVEAGEYATRLMHLVIGETIYTAKFSPGMPAMCTFEKAPKAPMQPPRSIGKLADGSVAFGPGLNVMFEPGSKKLKKFTMNGKTAEVTAQSDMVPEGELDFPLCYTFPPNKFEAEPKTYCVQSAEECQPDRAGRSNHKGITTPKDEKPLPKTAKQNRRALSSDISMSNVAEDTNVLADGWTESHEESAAARKLQQSCDFISAAAQYLSVGGSYGNWCGVGGSNGRSSDPFCAGKPLCADGGLDACCFRHDMSSYSEHTSFFGAALTLSPCAVDNRFRKDCIHHYNRAYAISYTTLTENSAECIFSAIPCLNYVETWGCWSTGWWFACGYYYTWDRQYIGYGSMTCNGPCYRSNAGHSWINDGWCDPSLNNAEGAWDGGDCCPRTCHPGRAYSCGVAGYDCKASIA